MKPEDFATPKGTQKQRVLRILKWGGSDGVRSDFFLGCQIPRAAARIAELKAEGLKITSTREKQFCRYTLIEPCAICMGEGVIEGVYACPNGCAENVESRSQVGPSSGNAELAGCIRHVAPALGAPAASLPVAGRPPRGYHLPPGKSIGDVLETIDKLEAPSQYDPYSDWV